MSEVTVLHLQQEISEHGLQNSCKLGMQSAIFQTPVSIAQHDLLRLIRTHTAPAFGLLMVACESITEHPILMGMHLVQSVTSNTVEGVAKSANIGESKSTTSWIVRDPQPGSLDSPCNVSSRIPRDTLSLAGLHSACGA